MGHLTQKDYDQMTPKERLQHFVAQAKDRPDWPIEKMISVKHKDKFFSDLESVLK